jgi:hypothetical protein
MQYKFYQGECSVDDKTEGDRRICTFEVNMAKKFEAEPNMVDKWDVAPKLILTSTKEWKDKSLWFNGVNEDYGSFADYEPANKKVKQLLKGVKDEMRKIEILTHWVADNIRYSGIPMGKGEGYTLHNTKTNFDDRCGVCKDKAAMLISMLRMAGFEAYPAMTMAGSRIESLPADHFNHCVAVVRRPDGSLMPLDPTWVPFMRELWSSAEQQQNYLPGIPEGSDLMCTPVSAPENHYLKISSDAVIDENGTMKGTLVVSAEGQSDAVVRRPWTTGWRAMEHQNLENELLKISPKAKLISVDSENSKDYQTGPIKITMKFEIPDYAVVDADFTDQLPDSVLIASAMDALSHAIESTTAKNASVFTKATATQAALDLLEYLPAAVDDLQPERRLAAREKVHMAATMAGISITNSFTGIVHSYDHPGPAFDLPHGIVCGIMLPYSMKMVGPHESYACIAGRLGYHGTVEELSNRLADHIFEFSRKLGLKTNFAELGIDRAAYFDHVPQWAEISLRGMATQMSPADMDLEKGIAFYTMCYQGI